MSSPSKETRNHLDSTLYSSFRTWGLCRSLNETACFTAGPILENAKVVWRDMGEDTEDAITVYLDGDPPVYSLEASRHRAG